MNSRGQRENAYVYPFNAIIGQENSKTILVLNAIDPTIGGALISGPKGTGKSLLVNSFSEILPTYEYIHGCSFHCNPYDLTNICQECKEKVLTKKLEISAERMRIVQVPLSVTEDMLMGSLDLEKTVTDGSKALEPGLLAEANQNILYIDEVNLLPDHITDSILDAAASGWNTVEREGISVSHPSRFILVGTMNPEEGELRPQILDRFGIFSETETINDPEKRAQIIDRNESFRRDPENFRKQYMEGLVNLRNTIKKARKRLTKVQIPSDIYYLAAETCSRLKMDGFRPDIITIKAARALAAIQGRDQVIRDDVMEALTLSLGHRTRRSGIEPPPQKQEIQRALKLSELHRTIKIDSRLSDIVNIVMLPRNLIEKLKIENFLDTLIKTVSMGVILVFTFFIMEIIRYRLTSIPSNNIALLEEFLLATLFIIGLDRLLRATQRDIKKTLLSVFDQNSQLDVSGRLKLIPGLLGSSGGGLQSNVRYIGEDTSELSFGPKILGSIGSLHKRTQVTKKMSRPKRKDGASSGGRRTKVITQSSRGRYAWYRLPRANPKDVAIIPTIKVASAKQIDRGRNEHILIKPEDIREKVREYYAPCSIVLLVDMSLSMIQSVTNIVKSVYDFHGEAYHRKDQVGLVVFKGSRAYTLLHPTRNLDLVVKKLREVGASDFTPLPAGLIQSLRTLKQEKMRNRDSQLHLYIISDGIVNVPLDEPLSPISRRRYSNEAQADSFDVIRLVVKEGIKVHVINTNHKDSQVSPRIDRNKRIRMEPTQFLMELAKASNGDYIGLVPDS